MMRCSEDSNKAKVESENPKLQTVQIEQLFSFDF